MCSSMLEALERITGLTGVTSSSNLAQYLMEVDVILLLNPVCHLREFSKLHVHVRVTIG